MKSEMTTIQVIGKRIQKLRRERGYTQQEFAEMIDLSTNYLSDIERGKSSARLDKLVTIINKLGCSADDLFADVIENGYKAKATEISEKIENLPPHDRKKAIAVLEAFLNSDD